MRRIIVLSFCFVVALALASPARAGVFTYNFASGGLSAAVTFNASGSTLTITLTNTGGDALVPGDVLTALFYNCTGCGTLTPTSATSSGSTYLGTTLVSLTGTNVGGEWAYASGIGGAPGGATQGISSSGFNFFGNANFNGPNLDGQDAVDGLNYGIVSAADNTSTGNGGVTSVPLTHDDVTFVLTSNTTITNATFGNVSVQYGTSLTETNIGGGSGGGSGQTLVPEPTSLLLFGSGLAVTAYRARRKKQQQKDS